MVFSNSAMLWLALSDGTPNRYKKITFWKAGMDELLVQVFLESHATAPEQIILDLDVTDFRYMGSRRGASSRATTTATVTCRCISSAETRSCVRVCGNPTAMLRQAV
jgi:hypothetical protein